MQRKLMKIYGGVLIVLFLTSFWSVWHAMAQGRGALVITEPVNNARFNPHADITLQASADAGLGRLKNLEFILDGRILGSSSNAPYSFVWSNAPAGTYKLLARAIPETGDAVQSPTIHIRIYHALLTFGLDNVGVLVEHALFGIPLWQYCASLIYVFLAFYVSKFLDYLTRVWLKKWAAKTETKFDDLLLDLLNGPIKVVAFIIFLRIGLEVFSWPAFVQLVLTKGFTVVVVTTVTYMALKFIDLVMGYWRQRTKPEADRTFDEQLFPIIRKSLKVFIIIIATLVTLDNIGVNITAAIASLSIGGLAVGLAAQDTLANLFGAVAVFADKPFRIGDHIQLEGVDGTVESIGLRSTRVRNLDGHHVTVPNKTMGNAIITNITRRPNIKTEMNIGIACETTTEKLKCALALLEEIYRAHPKTSDLIISFNKFADSSLNVFVVHWWNGTDMKAYWFGMQELNLKIKERFDAEGISFAFPTQTVYLKQDSEWRVTGDRQN